MKTSLNYWIYCMLLFFSCGSSTGDQPYLVGGNTATVTPNCTNPVRIAGIHPDQVYDLSAYESVGGNSPFHLFDENELLDTGNTGNKIPVTTPHPFRDPEIYFPANRGSRIVVDLRIPYQLKEVMLYDPADKGDSIWIYTGNMREWKLKASLKSGQHEGWLKNIVEDSTRFVMIRFNSVRADITEMLLYGCALQPLPPPLPPVVNNSIPKLPGRTLREFIGVNSYQGTPLQYMKPFYYSRVYTNINQIDRDTTAGFPGTKFFLTPHGWYHTGVRDYALYPDSIVFFNKTKLWYSLMGIPLWLEKKGLHPHDRPVTQIGMDPEDPLSYDRHASMMWNMAASYGMTKVDTSLIASLGTDPKFSGRKVMTIYENGNENDAYWVGPNFWNPVEYFAMSSADYDGHESRLGKMSGVKNADKSSELMMSGFASLNTNRLRILRFLCNEWRRDSQFLWNAGIQYHHYSTNGKGRTPLEIFGNATAGITPEEDSLRVKLTRIRNRTYQIQPGVECILGEYGYDKSRKSKVSAPLVPGFTQSESQGIMILRAINATAFSGFDRFILYWIKDTQKEDFEGVYLTSGVLYQDEHQRYTPYPGWYYISTLVHHLGEYVPDAVISEKGNVWIYRYRHVTQKDSIAYFIYAPTRNGTKVNNYALKTKGTVATVITFMDKKETGISEQQRVNGGAVRINVSEHPRLVFVKE